MVDILRSGVEVHTQVEWGDVLGYYPIIVNIHAAVVVCPRVHAVPRPLSRIQDVGDALLLHVVTILGCLPATKRKCSLSGIHFTCRPGEPKGSWFSQWADMMHVIKAPQEYISSLFSTFINQNKDWFYSVSSHPYSFSETCHESEEKLRWKCPSFLPPCSYPVSEPFYTLLKTDMNFYALSSPPARQPAGNPVSQTDGLTHPRCRRWARLHWRLCRRRCRGSGASPARSLPASRTPPPARVRALWEAWSSCQALSCKWEKPEAVFPHQRTAVISDSTHLFHQVLMTRTVTGFSRTCSCVPVRSLLESLMLTPMPCSRPLAKVTVKTSDMSKHISPFHFICL